MEGAVLDVAVKPMEECMWEREESALSLRGGVGVVGSKELLFEFVCLLLSESPVIIIRVGSGGCRGL
jgi:hypothetical protein